MTAQLIGIGVGTGDADLITLKAYKLLQSVSADNTVLAYIKPMDKPSMARHIVDSHLPSQTIPEIILNIPMQMATNTASTVYDDGANRIYNAIQSGKTVLFLCEGDALFYGSFMYIYNRLGDKVSTHIIPGITSVSSACSVAQIPFASRNDVCTIIPATLDKDIIIQHLQSANSIALMKIGRHFDKVKSALSITNRLDTAVCVQYASLPQQHISPVTDVSKVPYFSIILSTQQNLY